jgi:hypothetical protein
MKLEFWARNVAPEPVHTLKMDISISICTTRLQTQFEVTANTAVQESTYRRT